MGAEARPLVAIVGRPNVGKSTLFNRLLGRRAALTLDTPGVTRDRHYANAEWGDREVTLIDTGGFVPDEKGDTLLQRVRLQAQAAVEECQLVVFVADGQVGLTAADEDVARYLRKSGRAVVLVVNKSDHPKADDELAAGFHRLGLGEPFTVSAEHALGIETLKDQLIALLPPKVPVPLSRDAAKKSIRVAIVGRPNVGKSTLVNALLGREQVIVSDVSGTTRDSIDSHFTFGGTPMVLTDTAGIRKKGAVSQRVEAFSVLQALKVIDTCDVVALILDAAEPAVDQDARIAGLAEEQGRPLLLVVNKWDLKKGKITEEAFREEIRYRLKWATWAPIVFISAKEGLRVTKVLELALALHTQAHFRAPTPQLNRVVQHVMQEHPAPTVAGRTLKIYYAAQIGEAPPTFAFVCNVKGNVPDRYRRYLSNYLRQTFALQLPIRLQFNERPGAEKRSDTVKKYKARRRHQVGKKPARDR